MRFAISIPQFVADGTFDPDAFRAYVTRAEALGYESGWTQEQVIGTMPHLSPLEAMTFAAAHTTTLRLGCSVFVSPLHSPLHLAKAISSLDQLSRGRVEVGIGTGGQGRMFGAFGIDGEHLVSRFNEQLRIMQACWTEERINYAGRFWQVENAAMEPKPFQKPHPPIWFGGGHPNALRRAVRNGNGFFGAGSSTTASFADSVQTIRGLLAEEGRDPATFTVAKRVYIAVDENVDRARERVRAGLADLYSFFGLPDITPVAVYGSPEDCVRGVRAVVDAGAELVLFTPLFDQAEQQERLAAEVMPAFG